MGAVVMLYILVAILVVFNFAHLIRMPFSTNDATPLPGIVEAMDEPDLLAEEIDKLADVEQERFQWFEPNPADPERIEKLALDSEEEPEWHHRRWPDSDTASWEGRWMRCHNGPN